MHYEVAEKRFYLASTIASHRALAHPILNSTVLGPADYINVYQMSLALNTYQNFKSIKHICDLS